MNEEETEKRRSQISESMSTGLDLLILTMLGIGTKPWIEALDKRETFTTIDVRLPSEDVKNAIYAYLDLIKGVTGLEKGEIEAQIFGTLIIKGLLKEAEERGIVNPLQAIIKGMQKVHEFSRLTDEIFGRNQS